MSIAILEKESRDEYAEPSILRLGVLLSLLLHLCIFVYWGLQQQAPSLLLDKPTTYTYSVRLQAYSEPVAPPSQQSHSKPRVSQTSSDIQSETLSDQSTNNTASVAQKVIATKSSEKSAKVPVVVKEAIKKRKQKVLAPTEKAIAKITQAKKDKAVEPIVSKVVSRAEALAQKNHDLAEASTDVLEAEQAASYEQHLIAWLNRHKRYPIAAQKRRQQGIVTASFEIDSQGVLLDYHIDQSSGYRLLDKAVEKMLKKSSPMPKIPEGLRQGKTRFSYRVPIVFRL